MTPEDIHALADDLTEIGLAHRTARDSLDGWSEISAICNAAWDAGYEAAIAVIRGKAEAL